jgi:hypothetical protein
MLKDRPGWLLDMTKHDDSLFTDWTQGFVGISWKHQLFTSPVDGRDRRRVGDAQTSDEF